MRRLGHADRIRSQQGFTLLELILVMFLLAIVAGFVAPQMSSFIRGRNLNFEARRLLSLTHYAQQRAVSEGVPVVIWFDVKNASYGIDLVGGSEEGAKRISYTAEPGLTFVVTEVDSSVASEDADERFGLPEGMPVIRFNPDGFYDESSVRKVVIQQDANAALEVGQRENRLGYEIRAPNTAN